MFETLGVLRIDSSWAFLDALVRGIKLNVGDEAGAERGPGS